MYPINLSGFQKSPQEGKSTVFWVQKLRLSHQSYPPYVLGGCYCEFVSKACLVRNGRGLLLHLQPYPRNSRREVVWMPGIRISREFLEHTFELR